MGRNLTDTCGWAQSSLRWAVLEKGAGADGAVRAQSWDL